MAREVGPSLELMSQLRIQKHEFVNFTVPLEKLLVSQRSKFTHFLGEWSALTKNKHPKNSVQGFFQCRFKRVVSARRGKSKE